MGGTLDDLDHDLYVDDLFAGWKYSRISVMGRVGSGRVGSVLGRVARFSNSHGSVPATHFVRPDPTRLGPRGFTRPANSPGNPPTPPYFISVGLASVGNDTIKHAAHYVS